jgi:glutathione synthase/RimK-type ligase-like ATP-grasp enzyme
MIDNRAVRIAWCSDPKEFPLYNARLARHVRARGHEVVVLQRLADLDRAGGGFDVGILRTRDAPDDPECCQVAARLEQAGVPLVNSVAARDASRDKSLTHALFELSEIPQPEWSLAASAPSSMPGPVALKPLRGGRGDEIKVFDTVTQALAGADRPEHFLLQRFFPKAVTWRVIATPDRILRAFRVLRIGGIGRDERLAKLRLFYPPPRQVAALARRMVGAVGGGMMGADVILDSGRPLALEVNTNFYLPLFDRRAVKEFVVELERQALNALHSG